MSDQADSARDDCRSSSSRLKQLTFRLPPCLIRRLDRYAEQLAEAVPGASYSRSDAVRVLLESGLATVGLGRGRDGEGN